MFLLPLQDPKVKEMLPQIASFVPDVRNKMIENVRGFLTPGKQNKSVGGSLLPAVGIFLADNRIVTDAKVLDPPSLVACGVSIPKEKSEFFVPCLSRATFEIDPVRARPRVASNTALLVYIPVLTFFFAPCIFRREPQNLRWWFFTTRRSPKKAFFTSSRRLLIGSTV